MTKCCQTLFPDISIGENFQFCWHSNTQIHKYTTTQIHKYTNTQIHKHKYTNSKCCFSQTKRRGWRGGGDELDDKNAQGRPTKSKLHRFVTRSIVRHHIIQPPHHNLPTQRLRFSTSRCAVRARIFTGGIICNLMDIFLKIQCKYLWKILNDWNIVEPF